MSAGDRTILYYVGLIAKDHGGLRRIAAANIAMTPLQPYVLEGRLPLDLGKHLCRLCALAIGALSTTKNLLQIIVAAAIKNRLLIGELIATYRYVLQ